VALKPGLADAVYILPRQWYFADRSMWLVVRTGARPAGLVPAIEDAVWSVDADQPVVRVAPLDALVAGSAAEQRFAFWIFQAFALVALTLAAVGLFGLLAGSVAERRREIGVRCALGATRGQVLSSVLGQGLTLAGLGIALGVAGAAVLTRALDSLLFGISRLDPITYAAVVALVAGVAFAASWLPARAAVRVDPASALRVE
jgi:predicted lysophospholipase L1 biosynthesis ABC-type transport system permease subunit